MAASLPGGDPLVAAIAAGYQHCLALRSNGTVVAWGWNIQSDQVFLYARMDAKKTDAKLRENARAGVISLAERSLKYAAGNAFNITQREPGRPMFAGFFSTPGGMELVRAHYLTGKADYLKGAVQSCQFPAGCNPSNLVYTSGLGANPVKVPLELDARSSGQPVPPGLTVFGISDYFNNRNSFWDINLRFVNKPEMIWPDAYNWPLTEAYFDVWVLVSANEYVIDTWAPNVLVWGYLAARPDLVTLAKPLGGGLRICGRSQKLLPGLERCRRNAARISGSAPGGSLVLSGILAEKEGLVRTGFAPQPLEYLATLQAGEWVALHFRKVH